MKWHKRDTDEHEKSHVVELYRRHGVIGVWFWDHLNDVLAKYFNFWCPGCYKFSTTIFYAFFYPQFEDKQHRLIKKIMKFLNEENVIASSIGGRTIYIHYPDIIERTDEYTERCLKKAKDRKQEQPESARNCASECEQMSLYRASRVHSDARTFFENKGVKH